MEFNGYRNRETWLFMTYFEDFLTETLHEQQQEKEIKYSDVEKYVKYLIDEMYNGSNKFIIGSKLLDYIINEFLDEIDIKEVTDHIAHALDVE